MCLLCIHLAGLRSEELAIGLRYCALAGAAWAKRADGWDRVAAEAALLAAYGGLALGAAARRTGKGSAPWLASQKFAWSLAPYALGGAAAGGLFLGVELRVDTAARLCNAAARCCFGGAAWCLWGLVKTRDAEKEGLPLFR